MTTKIHKSHLALLKLIERDGNNLCADCGSRGTRWASWNLGIFLCIRCAGVHRNLGVHISKVKSVDLDSWTSEQMQSIESMGNQRSQKIYEAALPQLFVRPQTNYAVEEFIRAKYQYKRYCMSTENETNKASNEPNEPTKSKTKDNPVKSDLVTFEVCKEHESVEISDDSLSDPEYLAQKNKLPKSCHKVLSEGDLISFNTTSSTLSSNDLASLDHKGAIMSLYNQSNVNQSYQSSGNDVGSYHRGYGSSTEPAYHSTTNIPAYGHTNYLKQIQDKLSTLKLNLTAKFRHGEEPSPAQSQSAGHCASFQGSGITRDSGQTLAPDLWK